MRGERVVVPNPTPDTVPEPALSASKSKHNNQRPSVDSSRPSGPCLKYLCPRISALRLSSALNCIRPDGDAESSGSVTSFRYVASVQSRHPGFPVATLLSAPGTGSWARSLVAVGCRLPLQAVPRHTADSPGAAVQSRGPCESPWLEGKGPRHPTKSSACNCFRRLAHSNRVTRGVRRHEAERPQLDARRSGAC